MRNKALRWLALSLVLLALVGAGCKKKPFEAKVPKEKPAAFPYELMDNVVKAHVNELGRVDYQGLQKDRDSLESLLGYIATYGPESSPELFPTPQDKQAYYITAYNALVLLNVLSRYPIDPPNIDKIKVNFFYQTTFKVDGKAINLVDLENKIVRPVFKDPRNHFALNCGARGCPALPQEGFVPSRLDEQLDREARKFVLETRNVRLDGKTLYVSDIVCNFYPEDFVEYETSKGTALNSDKKIAKREAIVSYLNRYRPADQQLPSAADLTMKCIPYDWTPNDQALK
jgi:hypothetical protein